MKEMREREREREIMPDIADALPRTAKSCSVTEAEAEEEVEGASPAPPACVLPSVLRDRGRSRGAPPPVPPRSPRRPLDSARGGQSCV